VLGRQGLKHRPTLYGKHDHKMAYVSDVVTCKHVSTADSSAGEFDVVVDATGSPQGMKIATALCRPMGTLVLKSTCASGDTFNAAPFVIDELHVRPQKNQKVHIRL
jgi:threonine dehydrogenase-like Zn-dependent dehydrogenase